MEQSVAFSRHILTVMVILCCVWSPRDLAASEFCGGPDQPDVDCYATEIKSFLQSWVYAKGNGDVTAYFQHNMPMNSPRTGLTRAEWEQAWQQRLNPLDPMQVTLDLQSMGIGKAGELDVIFEQRTQDTNGVEIEQVQVFLKRRADGFMIYMEKTLDPLVADQLDVHVNPDQDT